MSMAIWSLRKRMIVISSLILILAFSIIYFITKSAYTSASKMRLQESLQAQLYALMAVADEKDGQIFLPEVGYNDGLNNLNSGLVAYVMEMDGELIWRSPSSDSFSVLPAVAGEYSMTQLSESRLEGSRHFWLGDAIVWEHENGQEGEYLFLIGEKQTLLSASVRKFKRQIMIWLSLTAIILIFVLAFALHFSLRPLRQAQAQIELVGTGEAEKIEGNFPDELLPLTSSINALLAGEARQKSRYRDALGNLAHSLKTPLAVMKSELEQLPEGAQRSQLQSQVERVDDIVRYQLNRSVVTAGQTLRRRSLVKPPLDKIISALNKVHAHKNLSLLAEVNDECSFPGEEGDLMELLGNLCDNACKWAQSKILVTVENNNEFLRITVNDDGPGIPAEKRMLILDRGKRLDQQAEGQGLGLSIVMDIVKTYAGEIKIDESALGGTEFSISIPT